MIGIAVVLGVLIGIVVGALGAGGGILAVPVLVYLLGQSPHDATASSLVIVGLTALVSLFSPGRAQHVKLREGCVFGFAAILGSVIGSRTSQFVDGDMLMYLFAALLIAVGIVMLRKGIRELRPDRVAGNDDKMSTAAAAPKSLWIVALAALFTGFLTGFFGVGGGFIVVPILILVLAMPIRQASSTSLLVMVITSVSGLLSRIGTDVHIDWLLILMFAAASMAGGFVGGPLTSRVKPAVLTITFGALLICVSAATGAASLL